MVLRRSAKTKKWFYGCTRWPECRSTRAVDLKGRLVRRSEYPSTPADAQTRAARSKAHAHFDVLWRSGRFTRAEAYRQLQLWMGLPEAQAHIGRFSLAQCERLLALLEGPLPG